MIRHLRRIPALLLITGLWVQLYPQTVKRSAYTLIVFVYPARMLPAVLKAPPGEYALRVENYATTGALTFNLARKNNTAGGGNSTVATGQAKRRWTKTVALEKGEYVATAAGNSAWSMTIFIDPAYPAPAVQ